MYDVLVIGARCAGSTTAMLLARKGYRVLLVDKATFPSDTMSTHIIHPIGIAKLKRWGVLDRLAETNCPPIERFTAHLGPFTFAGTTLPVDGLATAYSPRRFILDKILVDAAVEAGVELREGFHVQEILMEGDRVVGIRGRSANGSLVTEHASIVIGADGQHSLLARQVEAPSYNTMPVLGCMYYSYWSGLPVEGAEIFAGDNCSIGLNPTHDNLTCVIVEWNIDQFPIVRTDVQSHFLKALDSVGPLAARIHDGKQEERVRGSGDLPNFFRKPYGPGWALVGDAGYCKDPALGYGISDAFRSVDLLVEAVDAGLSEKRPLLEALSEYEQTRNERAFAHYAFNAQMAKQEPPSAEMQQLYSALQTNQTEINNLFAVIEGAVSPTEFFAPEHLATIIAAANS